MSEIEELRRKIIELSAEQRAQIMVWLLAEAGPRIGRGIDTSPGVCGDEPRIVRTRIPVWVLEQMRRLGATDAEILNSYPTLRAEDVVNAWDYVDRHQEAIEAQIRENEEA